MKNQNVSPAIPSLPIDSLSLGKEQGRLYNNKDWLFQKYWGEELSTYDISKLCGCIQVTIWRWLRKFNIKTRTHSEAQSGEKNGSWKGGRIKNSDGYVLIYQPAHPHASHQRYVYEHRLIAEKALGRYLKKDEVVHHINGEQGDNRNCNLLICTNSYHKWLTGRMVQLYQKEHFGVYNEF